MPEPDPGGSWLSIETKLVDRLFREAKGEKWRTPMDGFAAALEASAERAFTGRRPSSKELERYLSSLHLEDLAIACACASGDEEAWGHFVLEHRRLLFRAAVALDPKGGARELADSLYADLFGLGNRRQDSPGRLPRQPLFHYFHGRSSLATWLRSVLAQRYVDRLRTNRRLTALPDENSTSALSAPIRPVEPDRPRHFELMQKALAMAVAALVPRDRLRLACYYAQELTLAQTGRLLGEHEATVSRHLARTRTTIRTTVEDQLRKGMGLGDGEIAECFAAVTEEPGPLDLRDMLGMTSDRKEMPVDRSIEERSS